MKERVIIFNCDMVRAILSGQKTQTRRIVKPQPEITSSGSLAGAWLSRPLDGLLLPKIEDIAIHCPFGKVGDRVIPAMYIPSLDNRYCADLFGNIWSRAKSGGGWRLLSGTTNGKGYLTVTPASKGKYKTRLVHELVSEAFLGDRPAGMQIRHLDDNQKNNAPENLDYGTQEQNWSDRLVNGISLGEQHHNSKLTKEIAAEIRSSTLSQRKLSIRYGVSQSTIWAVRHAQTWNQNPVAQPPNMPRWASRILLEITDVRVERLNDISETDALAEGFTSTAQLTALGDDYTGLYASDLFAETWQSIYGAESWNANPWCWAITFRRIEGD